ncbi:pentapeptide repeat-containing protein [Tateyamaria armeniaca]|uniref:Pentapeptide repeat-containing protein n=1 Tax=Tateyamaria armeniaca TaxID=2518930 RepID=A0ABW8UWW6_9RHOB
MESTTITLPVPSGLVWGFATLAGIAIASWIVVLTLPEKGGNPAAALRDRLGMEKLPVAAFLTVAALWSAIALILFSGLFGLVVDVLGDMAPAPGATEAVWDFRFKLIQITALTTVLGAVIALPITMSRLRLQTEANLTGNEALFNDKINAATEGLYARRQVTEWREYNSHQVWQDDIVQRCAAIDRLEGLADENTSEIPRIARLLSVYVRELSVELPAQLPPEGATTLHLKDWVASLPQPRSDMEKAAQTLGLLNPVNLDTLGDEIDLRGANLQCCDLQSLNFDRARLAGTHLEGAALKHTSLVQADLSQASLTGADLWYAQLRLANLEGAQLQMADLTNVALHRADLRRAQMQGTNLWGAQLQEANLRDAQLQGTDLWGAQLQGANLWEAQFDDKSSLGSASLSGTALRDIDFTDIPQIGGHIEQVFGDASVTLPNGVTPDSDNWPEHWSKEKLGLNDFLTQWRAFQATLPLDWGDPDR